MVVGQEKKIRALKGLKGKVSVVLYHIALCQEGVFHKQIVNPLPLPFRLQEIHRWYMVVEKSRESREDK